MSYHSDAMRLRLFGPHEDLDELMERLANVERLPGNWMHVPSKEPGAEEELGWEILHFSREPERRDSVVVSLHKILGMVLADDERHNGSQERWNEDLSLFAEEVVAPASEGLDLDLTLARWSDVPDRWVITDESRDPPEVLDLLPDATRKREVADRLRSLARERGLDPEVERERRACGAVLLCGDRRLVARDGCNAEVSEGDGRRVVQWWEPTPEDRWVRRSNVEELRDSDAPAPF